MEIRLREKELDARMAAGGEPARRHSWLTSPLLVAVGSTIFGLLGTGVGAALQGFSNTALERQKFESGLIQKALETSDKNEAATNLQFLVGIGLISQFDTQKIAIADFGGAVLGKPVELVSADFQSKVDVGVALARRWYDDEGVDLVLGIPNSAIALALVKVAAEKNRIVMPTAAATSELTGKSCGPTSIHWIYDTYGQTKTIVNALAKMGANSWFFITVDYAFSLAVQADATQFIQAAGGSVVGSLKHPLNTSDF